MITGNIEQNQGVLDIRTRESNHVEHIRILTDRLLIGDWGDIDKWAIINDKTENLVLSTEHIFETNSIQFDKTDGGGGDAFAGIQSTLSKLVNALRFTAGDKLRVSIYLASTTNVTGFSVRMGSDANNYGQWTIANGVSPGWHTIEVDLAEMAFVATSSSGNGIDWEKIGYLQVRVNFASSANTLAGIRVDHVGFIKP